MNHENDDHASTAQAAFLKEHEPSSAILSAAGPLLPLVIVFFMTNT